MADENKVESRYNYFWIHNVFGDFCKTTIDYFADYLYPRFTGWKVISTYDKAVEFLNKQVQYHRETDQPMRPGLLLDPSGDFSFDETYGKQPWRYPNLAPGFVKYIFQPIYQDTNVLITVGFSRLVGEFTLTGLMSSFYEYTDMKIYLNLIFGGLNRPIYPKWFNSFIILPEEIVNYTYSNSVTGQTYKISLENSYNHLVKTTNTNELVYPCVMLPRYTLTNISDASSRLGGVEGLPDWKLAFTVNYEIEIPTFILLESDYLAEKAIVNVGYGACYSSNNVYETSSTVSDTTDSFEVTETHGLDATFSHAEITFPSEGTVGNKKTRQFKTRYYHIISQSEADSTTYIDITLPETITDSNLIRLVGQYGSLIYGDHYTIILDGKYLRINKTYVTLQNNDVLEIFVYQYV